MICARREAEAAVGTFVSVPEFLVRHATGVAHPS